MASINVELDCCNPILNWLVACLVAEHYSWECGRLASINVELDCCNPTLNWLVAVAAFCWYKMLIATIRGEIWSLFNTEKRVSGTERGYSDKDGDIGASTGMELVNHKH